jgi:hypothetical protein
MTGKESTSLARSPKAVLATIGGWDDLSERERQIIVNETRELNDGIAAFGRARVAIGEHLAKIRDVLEPKRMFTNYLKSTPFNISVATAYRYIDIYDRAKELFPGPVMRLALAMGMDTIDPKLVKKNPPPDTSSEPKLVEYLRDLNQKQKAGRTASVESDNEVLKKESFNWVRTRMERLPARQRKAWLESLITILTSYAEGKTEAVPEKYIVPRGRPRTIQAEEKAS